MTIRQRIRRYLSSSRSRSKLRSEPHEQDNGQPSQLPSKMASNPQDSGDGPKEINLDEALRPRKQSQIVFTTTGEEINPDNVMDDWLLSARESSSQRNSRNLLLSNAWEARNHLPFDRSNGGSFGGRWEYTSEETSKDWVASSPGISSRSTSVLSYPPLSAHKGDKKISEIYRKLWVRNEKTAFIRAIYKLYAENDVIPELRVWRIFRCLISELVPGNIEWKSAPPHIHAEPNTIWQVGKCMLHIVTRGHWWDDDKNVLNPKNDKGELFGTFKKKYLQEIYSKNLMKHILGCLSVKEDDRPSREQLLGHFQLVLNIYNGYELPPTVDDGDAPYITNDIRIPTGLTKKEGEVYEKLIEIAKIRKEKGSSFKTPHIITITDLAKDYDDLMAMMCLKELHRLDIVYLEGFVANLMPEKRRASFGRGALNSLGLKDTPCAVGTIGDMKRKIEEGSHEFDNTDSFMPRESEVFELPEGQKLLEEIFQKAIEDKYQLTFLGISSLMDIAKFAKNYEDLLVRGLSNVVLQGGYRVINNHLVADINAANNKFDMDGAQEFHTFMQHNKIPSTVWTKVATEAVSIYNSLFVFLEETGHPLGPYIRNVQVNQDLNFYKRACSDDPFAAHMTQDWYVKTKSTWFAAGHEPDEPYPTGKAMVPYFTKVVAYDALAAVGAAGEDILKAFHIIKPCTREDAKHSTHRIIGVPGIKAEGKQPAKKADQNLDGDMMGVIITALIKGSILAYQQGMECPGKF